MRAEKQLLLDEVKARAEASRILLLLRYQGLDANATADFRQEVVKAGGELTVSGKRVLQKAVELGEIDLDGHIAFVTSEEHPVNTTKAIFAFQKEHKETIEVLGGQFEGQACSAAEFKAVAELPTKEEMRAQMLGLFQAPMAQTVSVMQALLTAPLHCLENKTKKS